MGRRKSSNAGTTTTNKKSIAKTRRHSETSLLQATKLNKTNCNIGQPPETMLQVQYVNHNKQRSNSLSETKSSNISTENNNYENKQKLTNVNYSQIENNKKQQPQHYFNHKHMVATTTSEALLSTSNHNSMNFNELSNCIVTIEQYNNCNNLSTKNNQLEKHCNNDINKNHSDQNTTTATTASATYNLGNNQTTTTANKTGNNNKHINPLNEFQQMLQVKSPSIKCQQQMNETNNRSISITTLTCDALNYNNNNSSSTTTTTMNNTTINDITTNSISTECHSNINNTTHASSQNPATNTTDNENDANEFVSFEYVKKLLSETFDYMDEEGDSSCNNCVQNINSIGPSTTATSASSLALTASSKATTCVDVLSAATVTSNGIDSISADKPKPTTIAATITTTSSSSSSSSSTTPSSLTVAMTTTRPALMTAIEIVTNASNKNLHNENVEQEFANNFNMDYLENFL